MQWTKLSSFPQGFLWFWGLGFRGLGLVLWGLGFRVLGVYGLGFWG